jgi:hypothetical protein
MTDPTITPFEDATTRQFVFVCERCGRPLTAAGDKCASSEHTGPAGRGVGRAVRSSELARLAAAARAALGGWR